MSGVSEMLRTMYERVGGMPFFAALVERFYEGVTADPQLRPLYPDDLAPAQRSLTLFLAQYWGGPTIYSEEKGHPRLRMRHSPFVIGPIERDRWFHHMAAAVRAGGLAEAEAAELLAYFDQAATAMINQA